MVAAPNPPALRTATFYWLCDITWAGAVYYLASREVDAPSGATASTTVHYEDALEVSDADDALDLFGTSVPARSATITCHLYPRIDAPAATEAGRDPNTATAILRLWADDGTSAGITLYRIEGRLREAEYGAREEPVTFTLREAPMQDTARIPGPLERMDTTNWPNVDPERENYPYVTVIGNPGDDDHFGSAKKASPAYYSNTATDGIVVAGHHCAALTVRVTNKSNGSGDTITCNKQTDGRGQPVATVDFTGTTLTVASGDELFASWIGGGGVIGPDGSTALRGAGDVVIWLLRQTTLRVDWGRVESLRATLNVYKIDSWIQTGAGERISPWEFLRDNILPILPISARWSTEGLCFVPWRPDAVANDAVGVLVAAAPGTRGELPGNCNCSRVSTVKWTPYEDVFNEVIVSYGHNVARSQWHGRFVLTGHDATVTADSTASMEWLARTSEQLYGYRTTDLKSEAIWDPTTAALWARWWLRWKALPTRSVVYAGGSELAYLEPGDIVSLTDAEEHWTSRIFFVERRKLGPHGDVELALRSIENPARDALVL